LKRTPNRMVEQMHRRLAEPDAATIDELYGLEPVYEPAECRGHEALAAVSIRCPYCWESYDSSVDLTGGPGSYVEDCQVCCQPIEVTVDVGDSGELAGLRADRMD
jgi:hypothetical protein